MNIPEVDGELQGIRVQSLTPDDPQNCQRIMGAYTMGE